MAWVEGYPRLDNGWRFMQGPYVCISAYKHDVVVIKMGAYIHGYLLLWVPIIQIYSIRLLKSV